MIFRHGFHVVAREILVFDYILTTISSVVGICHNHIPSHKSIWLHVITHFRRLWRKVTNYTGYIACWFRLVVACNYLRGKDLKWSVIASRSDWYVSSKSSILRIVTWQELGVMKLNLHQHESSKKLRRQWWGFERFCKETFITRAIFQKELT